MSRRGKISHLEPQKDSAQEREIHLTPAVIRGRPYRNLPSLLEQWLFKPLCQSLAMVYDGTLTRLATALFGNATWPDHKNCSAPARGWNPATNLRPVQTVTGTPNSGPFGYHQSCWPDWSESDRSKLRPNPQLDIRGSWMHVHAGDIYIYIWSNADRLLPFASEKKTGTLLECSYL